MIDWCPHPNERYVHGFGRYVRAEIHSNAEGQWGLEIEPVPPKLSGAYVRQVVHASAHPSREAACARAEAFDEADGERAVARLLGG